MLSQLVRRSLPARAPSRLRCARRIALWAVSLVATSVMGCGLARDDADLLQLSALSPGEVEPGGQLRVDGEGFPAGQPCQVTFVGETRGPGRNPVHVRAVLPGRAVSPGRVAVRVDEAAFGELGGRGSFRGGVTLAFATQADTVRVVGRLDDVRFDLSRPFEQDMASARQLRSRALATADFLGIVVDREAESHAGVRVDWAAPGSRAERAGLVHGDVIVDADGVQVHALADLAPAPGRGALRLSVHRPGQGTPVPIRLSLSGFEAPALEAALRPLVAVLVCVLLIGIWFGPLPGPTPFLARCLSRYRYGVPLFSVRVWDDLPASAATGDTGFVGRVRHRTGELFVAVLVSALLFAIAVGESAYDLRFNTLPVYLALSGLRLGVSLLVKAGPAGSDRRADAGKRLARMAVLAVTIAIACAHGGTRCLEGIVGVQGGVPWRWGLFQHPPLMLVFAAFVLQGSRTSPTHLGRSALAAGLAYALDVGTRMLICALGAAIFLGGWEVSGLGLALGLPALIGGALLFTAKAWLVALLLHFGKLVRLGATAPRWFTPGLCLTALAVAGGWIALAPGEQAVLAVGTVTFSVTAITLAISGLRLRRSPNPMAPTLIG